MPRICKECSKRASFGYTKPPEYCKTHKKDVMLEVKDVKKMGVIRVL